MPPGGPGQLRERLRAIEEEARDELTRAATPEALEDVRVRYLGRKGRITQELKSLASLPPEERPGVGEAANQAKAALAEALDRRAEVLLAERETRTLAAERLDLTLPGRVPRIGLRHPLSIALDELRDIFRDLGYEVADGPEVETPYHNFTALNIPEGHPVREESDSIFVGKDLLLRTHTSPVQIRAMESRQPPLRIIAPGRCYRNDAPDATHSPVFYQIEVLAVEAGITLGHLKWTLEQFARAYFGQGVGLRFRPGYFPFVEPGAELDISCVFCAGAGCPTCKQSGWIEILGAGMVHPAVFEAVGYDPEVVSGFAFGTGVERMAMLKHGIPDIRLFYENDLRFLAQFN
ncbi:MAG TPA: phenylalanine--tRNA ligase subunit alpha [Gemmatimonadota bacterium]|jgi:phenylalanyl-tRNA synthetase alpha chain